MDVTVAGPQLGGRAVVEELYPVAYQRLVFAVYALTGDLSEAQDVVHDAFAIASARPHMVAAAASPEAWLRTVALNLARGRFRRRLWMERFLRRSAPEPESPSPDPNRVALLAAMRRLSPVLRETLGLFYLADLSIEEISVTLGVPAGTVKARLSRGRKALADILGTEEGSNE